MIVLFKRHNNFGDNKVWKKKKKKSSTPSPQKMGMFAEKSQKITIFQL